MAGAGSDQGPGIVWLASKEVVSKCIRWGIIKILKDSPVEKFEGSDSLHM